MRLSIFIRTYRGDSKWLAYCLYGIKKFVKHDELIIICPKGDRQIIYDVAKDYDHKLYTTKEKCNGYLAQQADKLRSPEWCTGDIIMIVDSDCIFKEPVGIDTFIKDEKPILLRTKYSSMDGAVLQWQSITEKAIGFRSDWEYMRRLPLLFWRDTLIAVKNAFPNIQNHIEQQKGHEFSEFNFIGQFIEKWENHKYSIINTEEFLPKEVCAQFWSWSKMTNNEEIMIKKILVL